MKAALLTPIQRWTCPNCTLEQITHEAQPHSRFHACLGLHGLTAPMLPAGTKAKVEMVEREDYIGSEQGGRAMAVVTTRDDGQDVIVFASTAIASVKE